MTVKELNKLLSSFMKEYPDWANKRVFLSIDEEGNAFKTVEKDCLAIYYLDNEHENKYGYVDPINAYANQEDSEKELEQIVVIYPNS